MTAIEERFVMSRLEKFIVRIVARTSADTAIPTHTPTNLAKTRETPHAPAELYSKQDPVPNAAHK